ncbi:hypothetical protein [Streptomyces sp. NBC_01361]|nr:hypothetical protein [Streptomyces sp. NBC_01361]
MTHAAPPVVDYVDVEDLLLDIDVVDEMQGSFLDYAFASVVPRQKLAG